MQKTVTLQPGDSQEVVFTFTPTEPGVYQVMVDELSGSLIAVLPEPAKPDYLNGELVGTILYYKSGVWSTTRDWSYNSRSLAQFPIKNTGSVRHLVGIDFMGRHEGVWLNPRQSIDWEIDVLPQEGTYTYPYYIWVRDPDTREEWVVEEGSLTITGVFS